MGSALPVACSSPPVQRGHWTWKERIQDEIKMGIRPKVYKGHPRSRKAVVLGLLERGGRVRTFHVSDAIGKTLQPILKGNIEKASRLVTDGHPAYRMIKNHLRHDVIDHEIEYVRGDVHTQGVENYWSLLKRGLYGVFHHVDEGYLGCYLNEFQYRFNRRKISDEERFASLMGRIQGRVLWYCQTPQPQNPYA